MKKGIASDVIEQRIFLIRGHRVMIDRDLAELYGVETKYLNRQVKRNIQRFPGEFMFRLTKRERDELVTNWHRFQTMKHSSSLPFVFGEHGVAMLSSVLKSETAVKINILIIKAFIKLRETIVAHKEFFYRLQSLEERAGRHDEEIQAIFDAIRKLTCLPVGRWLRCPGSQREESGFIRNFLNLLSFLNRAL